MSLGSALQQAHIAITSPSKLRQRNSSRPAGLCVGQHHGHDDGHFREVKHCLCCSKATTQLQNDVSPASTPYSQLPALKHFPTSHDGAPAALLRKACTVMSGTAQKTQHAVTHANPLAQPLLLHPCSTVAPATRTTQCPTLQTCSTVLPNNHTIPVLSAMHSV